jgi:hypothetical protein
MTGAAPPSEWSTSTAHQQLYNVDCSTEKITFQTRFFDVNALTKAAPYVTALTALTAEESDAPAHGEADQGGRIEYDVCQSARRRADWV